MRIVDSFLELCISLRTNSCLVTRILHAVTRKDASCQSKLAHSSFVTCRGREPLRQQEMLKPFQDLIMQRDKQSSEQRELLFRSHVPNHLSEQHLVDLRCSFPKLPAHRSYLTRLLVSFKKQTRVLRLTGQGDQVPCAKILRNNNCGL